MIIQKSHNKNVSLLAPKETWNNRTQQYFRCWLFLYNLQLASSLFQYCWHMLLIPRDKTEAWYKGPNFNFRLCCFPPDTSTLGIFTTKQLVPKHNCVGRHCLLHSDWGTEAASLFGLSWQTIWIMLQGFRPSATSLRCEDNLAATSVTPLIIRVDSVDLAV